MIGRTGRAGAEGLQFLFVRLMKRSPEIEVDRFPIDHEQSEILQQRQPERGQYPED